MPVPDFQTMMLPALEAVADGKIHTVREVGDVVAKHFGLTDEERLETTRGGEQSKFANRIAWVVVHFVFARLFARPARAQVNITELGLSVLKSNPKRIDLKFLRQFSHYNEARTGKKDAVQEETETEVVEETIAAQEALEKNYEDLRKALAAEILDLVKSKPPVFLERLVLQLMQRLGYGSLVKEATEHLGGRGDGGVDGLVKEDKLGLDVIYVQAKRWDGPVTPKIVREFLGALDQAGAKKGVLITTSSFTKDAKAPLGKTDKKISLIDGQMLAELMIDHDLGVASGKVFQLKKVDSDFFED